MFFNINKQQVNDAKAKLERDKKSKNRRIKEFIKKYPAVYGAMLKLRNLYLRLQSREKIFSSVYNKNTWADAESLSGPGSNLNETTVIRKELPKLFKKFNVKSIVDVPCGDFYWMKYLIKDYPEINYFGGDIVKQMIHSNNLRFGNSRIKFRKIDIVSDKIPKGDIMLCRDCLIHLSFSDGIKAIENIKGSDSKYLLSTTFSNITVNKNSPTGSHGREINLQLHPYNFPKPILLINEGVPKCPHKNLGLWRIEDMIRNKNRK
ncbi:MAG: class I SAM-dependent methyltransferase [Nanoarchaeota archaeon]